MLAICLTYQMIKWIFPIYGASLQERNCQSDIEELRAINDIKVGNLPWPLGFA